MNDESLQDVGASSARKFRTRILGLISDLFLWGLTAIALGLGLFVVGYMSALVGSGGLGALPAAIAANLPLMLNWILRSLGIVMLIIGFIMMSWAGMLIYLGERVDGICLTIGAFILAISPYLVRSLMGLCGLI